MSSPISSILASSSCVIWAQALGCPSAMMKRVLGSLFLDGCLKSVRLGLRISVYLDDHFLDDQTRH